MRYFVVDAFADKLFQGNPAGVCVADGPLSEGLMQRIASENNLSETAFLARRDDGEYDLRWFTPLEEIDLCGHATLGSSFVVFNELEPDRQSVAFHTRSGVLRVARRGELLEMAFPVRRPERVPLDPIAPLLIEALGVNPVETWLYRDLLVLVNSQRDVERLVPDVGQMRLLPMGKEMRAARISCPGFSRRRWGSPKIRSRARRTVCWCLSGLIGSARIVSSPASFRRGAGRCIVPSPLKRC